ncbi:hypothetical protein PVL29_025083 [Vitis rotundifolia]|uniref:Kinesin motor domain-containing protein n=1 Tax=Vitis rotundifolia TaxID=103349 RepID=A0AA38YTH2_VITRO|nr:hypothetical protein PVL29_025083 [Vitis rotundifolia]
MATTNPPKNGCKNTAGESLSPRSTRGYLRTSNIRVFCRCRPLNQAEIANGSTSIVDFDSSQENELQIICSDSSKKQFKFDHVFRPGSDQGCFCTNFTNCDFHAGWVQRLYICLWTNWNWKDLYNGRNSRK